MRSIHAYFVAERIVALARQSGRRRVSADGLAELDQGATTTERGVLTLVPVTNPLAYRLGHRQGDRNLNRNLRVTPECGQHDALEAPTVAYRAIRQTLALLGLATLVLEAPASDFEVLRLVDLIDRDHPADRFTRGWASFDPVATGALIGQRANGRPVVAPSDGFVVFPTPSAPPATEWFYFAQRSDRPIV
jgi:hypothetical protein